jgi:hypothetical protein
VCSSAPPRRPSLVWCCGYPPPFKPSHGFFPFSSSRWAQPQNQRGRQPKRQNSVGPRWRRELRVGKLIGGEENWCRPGAQDSSVCVFYSLLTLLFYFLSVCMGLVVHHKSEKDYYRRALSKLLLSVGEKNRRSRGSLNMAKQFSRTS